MCNHLVISVLIYRSSQTTKRFLQEFLPLLSHFCSDAGIRCTLLIRSNSHIREVDVIFEKIKTAPLDVRLIQSDYNLGFGGGHNANFDLCPGDIFWIQSADIEFKHLEWLREAIKSLSYEQTGFVSSKNTLHSFSPIFCNDQYANSTHSKKKHTEAPIMLIRSNVFKRIGGFDSVYSWPTFENLDLSMRIQQAGHQKSYIDIPYRRIESSSVDSMPHQTKSSKIEMNRSLFIAKWNTEKWNEEPSGKECFDLFAAGLGDIFTALPAVYTYSKKHASAEITINIPESMWCFIPDLPNVKLIDTKNFTMDISFYDKIASLRRINYSVPFHIGDLTASALGIKPANPKEIYDYSIALFKQLKKEKQEFERPQGDYALFHYEFSRRNHHGRGPGVSIFEPAFQILSEKKIPVVVIGTEKDTLNSFLLDSNLTIDLRGKTSLKNLIPLAAHAKIFMGIDSFPMHVAQCFGIPSVVFFGTVSPLTRLWNTHSSYPIRAEGLDCLGCHHEIIFPSIPYCQRGDEACLKNISPESVKLAILRALDGTPPDTFASINELRRWQAQYCFLHMHHPDFKSKIFSDSITPLFHHHRGIFLRSNGDIKEAKKAQETAIALDPSMPGPHMQLSHIFNQRGNINQAIQKVQDAIAIKDDNPDFYHHLGNLLRKNGDFEGAKQAQEKAIALDPKSVR